MDLVKVIIYPLLVVSNLPLFKISNVVILVMMVISVYLLLFYLYSVVLLINKIHGIE